MSKLIAKIAEIAIEAHSGQKRKTGELYITHPFRVFNTLAIILRDYGMTECVFEWEPYTTEHILAASIAHDVLEDTPMEYFNEIQMSSCEVARLVAELTNPSIHFSNLPRVVRKKMDFKHIERGSTSAKLIKIADRLDNLQCYKRDRNPFFTKYAEETKLLISCLLVKVYHPVYNTLLTQLEEYVKY